MPYEFKVSASGQKIWSHFETRRGSLETRVLQKWNCNWIYFVTWAAVTMWPVVKNENSNIAAIKSLLKTWPHTPSQQRLAFHKLSLSSTVILPKWWQKYLCYSFIDDHRKLRSFKKSLCQNKDILLRERDVHSVWCHKDQSLCNIWIS